MVVWQWLTYTHSAHRDTETQMHVHTFTLRVHKIHPNTENTDYTLHTLSFFSCNGADVHFSSSFGMFVFDLRLINERNSMWHPLSFFSTVRCFQWKSVSPPSLLSPFLFGSNTQTPNHNSVAELKHRKDSDSWIQLWLAPGFSGVLGQISEHWLRPISTDVFAFLSIF